MPSGFTAAAALRLATVPNILGNLDVTWGPILLTTNNSWTIPDSPPAGLNFTWDGRLESLRFPRKFFSRSHYGRNLPALSRPNAGSPHHRPERILGVYIRWISNPGGYDRLCDSRSQQQLSGGAGVQGIRRELHAGSPACAVPNCCSYIVANGDTATFTAGAPGFYTVTQSTNVVFVDRQRRIGQCPACDHARRRSRAGRKSPNLKDKQIPRIGHGNPAPCSHYGASGISLPSHVNQLAGHWPTG